MYLSFPTFHFDVCLYPVDVCIYISYCVCSLLIPVFAKEFWGMDGMVGEHDHFGWGSVKRILCARFLNFLDKNK